MADRVWFEVPGKGTFPNKETAKPAAREAAKATDAVVEIYKCTRTLVGTVQRNTTYTETDIP